MGIHDRKQRMTISIDSAVKQELEERIPSSKRSKFVEAAVAGALREIGRQQALKMIREFKPIPSDGQDSVEILRQLRTEREAQLASRHSPDRR